MPEQDAEEEDVRAEKQARVEQGLWNGERMPCTTSASHLVSTRHASIGHCSFVLTRPFGQGTSW